MTWATTTVIGELAASLVVQQLALASAWFEFTPLPDDVYEIRVKPDRRPLLKAILQTISPALSSYKATP